MSSILSNIGSEIFSFFQSVRQAICCPGTFYLCGVEAISQVFDSQEATPSLSGRSSATSLSLSRNSTSEYESGGVVRRILGSFGKGQSKKGKKKERCASQFYAPADYVVDINERSRAISLPDIKQPEQSPELTNPLLRHTREGSCSTAGSGSNEAVHLDSDDEKEAPPGKKINKAYSIAKEITTSEQKFIEALRLLNITFRNTVEFKNTEQKAKIIPDADIKKILNYLPELLRLNEDILEDFQQRINNWEKNPKIADVIVKKGAFLKMYATYIQNYESQSKFYEECLSKYPKFLKVVQDFEKTEICQKLSLQHYMLKPVQRIPQYKLLLKEYEKSIDENSPDFADTLHAYKIVSEVADHANRSLSSDVDQRMWHYQSLLTDFELIKPGRVLIKDGALEKICRKDNKERHFILVNDALIHTTYSKNYMKIHRELPLAKIRCEEEKNPCDFRIISISKSFILRAKSHEERQEWVVALRDTIEEYHSRRRTLAKLKPQISQSFQLGKEAPVWTQDNNVTMCQICSTEFTAIFRRHHCRACGKVICRNCGSNNAPLQYKNFKTDRVCDYCFDLLLEDYQQSKENICEALTQIKNLKSDDVKNEYSAIYAKFVRSTTNNMWKEKQKLIPERLKEVPANATDSVISGWLHKKTRRSWKLTWYVLKQHVLYVYRATEDLVALETIPVLGYNVIQPQQNIEDIDKKLIFILDHRQQPPLVFYADDEDSANRWFTALRNAATFDLE